MSYRFTTKVRDDAALRRSFNELTRQTFGFDFEGWYRSGGWRDLYIPHVLTDGDKIVSNISVNLMQFQIGETVKNYIQLGTVMTDVNHRGQGLNREIMERILEEYADKVDGIYLFGNDSVLEYYPKFGFKASKEYEYYLSCGGAEKVEPYALEKVDMSDEAQSEKLYDTICTWASNNQPNDNDALYMNKNLGLYQFWMAAEYGDQVYYAPEANVYVIAELQERTLRVIQVLGKEQMNLERLAYSFGAEVKEVVFGFTPTQKENLQLREHKEEDCTLFILGKDMERMEEDKMMFPILSHA